MERSSSNFNTTDFDSYGEPQIFSLGKVPVYVTVTFEIRNAKEANELLLASFGGKRPLDTELIREFQKMLTQNTYDTRRYVSVK